MRAWPQAHRKMQRRGPKSRFLTTLFVPKRAFPPPAALWGGLSMLVVQEIAFVMHNTDEGITVLPIHLSGVKSDENVGRNSVYS